MARSNENRNVYVTYHILTPSKLMTDSYLQHKKHTVFQYLISQWQVLLYFT